ncbi:MAG: CARDB domain-containing protein [Candidatus Thalassarchaeaceae archaeon]|jgi:hypothetical protein|nr:CARDB domain-containing protein [Candidatus Thalassarchaeaceae archaeon]
MMGRQLRALGLALALTLVAQSFVVVSADTVITAEEIEVLTAGAFEDQSEWDMSATSGFSGSPAEYTVGMVADGELSFTHDRPENLEEETSWSQSSITDSNSSTGSPDSFYTWSKGPNITVGGFDFSGLHSREIANVSLVLHFEIPDNLNSDSVRVVLQNVGSDKLVKTYTRTLSGVFKMNNPLVIPVDDLADWSWGLAEGAAITFDYVSQGGGSDDSEVRVDAVGVKVRYYQPWYSFENSMAINSLLGGNSPVIDISPYEGSIEDMEISSCGLIPLGGESGTWLFDIEVPPLQQLGRIHTFGTGNHTIWALPGESDGEYVQVQSGEILDQPESLQHIRIEVQDGCISGARVDVNDPHLIVSGSVAGSVSGLSPSGSSIRFAIGEYLVEGIPIELGDFHFEVPIGHALPSSSESVDVGVAARFQWASDGTNETTVVHIDSMSISGGYLVEWDLDPTCIPFGDVELEEDGGGVLIPLSARCSDDITAPNDLTISTWSSDVDVIDTTSSGSDLILQPVANAHGTAEVYVEVADERGNLWIDSFVVDISEVPDEPIIEGLPLTAYIELGESMLVEMEISDPDTDMPSVMSSKSWATIDQQGHLTLAPVAVGTHIVEITASDGTNQISQEIEVIVTAKPDLIVESVEIVDASTLGTDFSDGEVIRITVFVRNQGMGGAAGVDVRCLIDDVFVGTTIIDYIDSGSLGEAVCDAAVSGPGTQLVRIVADGTDSIHETNEDNNEKVVHIDVSKRDTNGAVDSGVDRSPAIIVGSVGLVAIALTALRLGPGRIRKPYDKRRK